MAALDAHNRPHVLFTPANTPNATFYPLLDAFGAPLALEGNFIIELQIGPAPGAVGIVAAAFNAKAATGVLSYAAGLKDDWNSIDSYVDGVQENLNASSIGGASDPVTSWVSVFLNLASTYCSYQYTASSMGTAGASGGFFGARQKIKTVLRTTGTEVGLLFTGQDGIGNPASPFHVYAMNVWKAPAAW